MGYSQFNNIEDFIADPSFRNWVLNHDTGAKQFWKEWAQANPDKLYAMNYAVALLKILQDGGRALPEEVVNYEVNAILSTIKAEEPVAEEAEIETYIPEVKISWIRRYWMGAAAAVIVTAAGAWYWYYQQCCVETASIYASYDTFKEEVKNNSFEYINNADTAQLMKLADGSEVLLSGKSKLTYSKGSAAKREVYLDGEAFFKVTKNPAQPFIVYTKDIVTKVLGTSFWVKAYPTDKKATVIVKTGKVSVFKRENFTEVNMKAFELGGLVVTPNQQVFFTYLDKNLHRLLIEKPVVLDTVMRFHFDFDATPVKEVFSVMQKAYGINIVFDEELLGSCSLSANMGTESFYEKLDLICKTLNARYEIIDGNVVITSSGCR
ncbi:MAG: FecR family protein [Chitinophagaceae bacterium]